MGVNVGVTVGVTVGVAVTVGVGVTVGVSVGVAVGANKETVTDPSAPVTGTMLAPSGSSAIVVPLSSA
ncbi:MAG: hypothetical protein KatS3mg011_2448 [Acidimicrobiia bacterium]|nr:MAG: hypothetical protein KatS3mg011_2448 [Acidimicrobiia bacterium]